MTLRDDVAVGWEALERWGDDVMRIEPLTGGAGVKRCGACAPTGSSRSVVSADAATLTSRGRPTCCGTSTGMPVPVPTTDGRYFADGLVLMAYPQGRPRRADRLGRAHVDVPDLDLALTHNAAGLDDDAYDIAAQARTAWESAVCREPTGTDPFAVERLAEVRPV